MSSWHALDKDYCMFETIMTIWLRLGLDLRKKKIWVKRKGEIKSVWKNKGCYIENRDRGGYRKQIEWLTSIYEKIFKIPPGSIFMMEVFVFVFKKINCIGIEASLKLEQDWFWEGGFLFQNKKCFDLLTPLWPRHP